MSILVDGFLYNFFAINIIFQYGNIYVHVYVCMCVDMCIYFRSMKITANYRPETYQRGMQLSMYDRVSICLISS